MKLKSKRFLLMCVYTALYCVVLFILPELAGSITPYTYGLAGAYIIGESWKPTE